MHHKIKQAVSFSCALYVLFIYHLCVYMFTINKIITMDINARVVESQDDLQQHRL